MLLSPRHPMSTLYCIILCLYCTIPGGLLLPGLACEKHVFKVRWWSQEPTAFYGIYMYLGMYFVVSVVYLHFGASRVKYHGAVAI